MCQYNLGVCFDLLWPFFCSQKLEQINNKLQYIYICVCEVFLTSHQIYLYKYYTLSHFRGTNLEIIQFRENKRRGWNCQNKDFIRREKLIKKLVEEMIYNNSSHSVLDQNGLDSGAGVWQCDSVTVWHCHV